MKKLLIGILVCSMAGMVFATPSFVFPDAAPVILTPGVPTTIVLQSAGVTSSGGMALYLETSDPFQIADVVIDGAGSGTVWETNSSGANIYTNAKTPADVPVPQLAVGYVTTSSGTVNAGAGILAKIVVSVPVGTLPGTQGWLTTNSPTMQTPSSLSDGAGVDLGLGQATIALSVIPEPVTALLLLAGIPMLRRRHA